MIQKANIDQALAVGILDRLPRVVCGNYPTPLEELLRLRKVLGPGCPRIFIKRDDYTGTAFGSNKLRKLDYAIAHEIQNGTNIIVTIAGECSNHARVTAAVCAKQGLKCILVLSRAADHAGAGLVSASRFAYELFGAEVHWVESRDEREEKASEIVDVLRGQGSRAAFLPLGVSFPLGAVGFVQAVRETTGQFAAYNCSPTHVFHASTSGGTQAGLVAGYQIFGEGKTQIYGVSPDDSSEQIASRVESIYQGILELMGDSINGHSLRDVHVIDTFIGDGYGMPTKESNDAAKALARAEGVILDHTYTAKAFAAMLWHIEKGRADESDNVLFWHTGGQLGGLYAPANGGATLI